MTSGSMRGVTGAALTVALDPADGVGDTDGVDTDRVDTGVGNRRWVMSLEVRERYAPDEAGERVIGVSGRIPDDAGLDGDEGIDDDGGEYDIGDEDMGEDDSPGMSGSVSNNSVSDSNDSDSIKLESSEWCDDRNEMLEPKVLGEPSLSGGGVSGMAIGLALPVTTGRVRG